MYRRRPRSSVKRVSIPLGELRLDVGAHDAPDGTMTTCENIRPAGPPGRPYYSPVVLPRRVSKAFGTVVGIGRQQLDGATKLVVVTTEKVWLVDPDSPSGAVAVYTFDSISATRKVQFADVGTRTYIATSTGAFPETPECLLMLIGTTCRKVYFPQLPQVEATGATDVTGGGLNPDSTFGAVYGYRWAYVLRDGTVGPPSRPSFFHLDNPSSDGWKMEFTINGYPDSDNPADDSWWTDEVEGIALYMSGAVKIERTDVLDAIMGAAFYRVGDFPGVAALTQLETTVTDAELVSGETLDDDNLWQHDLEASAAFSYNEQLVLGDAQYDFRRPNTMAQFDLGSKNRTLSTDYAWRLGVTIKTAKGTFQRIGDPVYTLSGATTVKARGVYSFPSTAWQDGMLVYPDRRVTQFQIYVDNNNDGAFELLATYTAQRVGNLSYASVASIDLTGSLTTAMPDLDTIHATRDRDPNRVLRSEAFQAQRMPAANALYSAVSDSDAVIAFQANTLPISEGQYGDAPLIVFGRHTTRALEMDASGALTRAIPLAQKGVVSRYGVTNGDGVIFVAAEDGIWTYTPGLSTEPVSAPVHAREATADLIDDLDSDTTLAYIDDGRGNREVWVGTASKTWAYSVGYRRWFTLDRKRVAFLRHRYSLYGYDAEAGDLVEEVRHNNDGIDVDGRGSAASFSIVTRPMTMGVEPGQVRRIYRISIRQRNGLDYLHYALYDPIEDGEVGGEVDAALVSDVEGTVLAASVSTAAAALEYQRFVTVDGAVELEVSGSGTMTVTTPEYEIPEWQRLVAVDSLNLADDGDNVLVYGDLFVVGQSEGALVAAGSLSASVTDIQGHDASLCRDAYLILTGKGRMGQGIESIDFDLEPRLSHRPRKRNY